MSVEAQGKVAVTRVVCAIDCCPPVNPNSIAAQMEGGIVPRSAPEHLMNGRRREACRGNQALMSKNTPTINKPSTAA